MPDLKTLIAEAIRAEAKRYPGDDVDAGPCVASEESDCLDAHVHEQWSVGGVIRGVVGSPEAFAAAVVPGVAAWLRERADERQRVADALDGATARTIVSIRVDELRRLVADADPAACPETWGDEVGCAAGPGDHRCTGRDGHTWHRCRCGALMLEDPKGD